MGTVVAGDFTCVTSPLDVEENYWNRQSNELIQQVQTKEMMDVYREKKPLGGSKIMNDKICKPWMVEGRKGMLKLYVENYE